MSITPLFDVDKKKRPFFNFLRFFSSFCLPQVYQSFMIIYIFFSLNINASRER